ncbi:MAG TPA: serpin family protein [Verrucomicrobiae bacterium]|nr:serpin family protein [Verrucomicrobiae bacterium]
MNLKTLWGMQTALNRARICVVVIAAVALQRHSAEGTEMKTLVEGNTAFAVQLYGKLRSAEGNLVVSPYSISSALSMTCAGARGETAQQMEQALHFGQSKSDLHALFGRLDKALKAAQGRNELNIANSLWPQKTYPFRQEFLNLLRKNYGATVTPLNYEREAEQARVTINQWVDDKTRHKITEIIGPKVLDESTRMVLVNAIYFKGTWATPFPEFATQPDKFYTQSDTSVTVPFMHKRGPFSYGENDQLQLIALPYAGRKLEMLVLLPRSRDGIEQLENGLTAASLSTWTSGMLEQQVDVALPKFKMSSGFNLAKALAALGVTDAFDSQRADFSGMDGRPHWLYISAMLHKAYVDVNEKGTEAAAATAVVTTFGAAPPRREPPREFRADHPFLFLIRDATTGSILFMGRVSHPGND